MVAKEGTSLKHSIQSRLYVIIPGTTPPLWGGGGGLKILPPAVTVLLLFSPVYTASNGNAHASCKWGFCFPGGHDSG